MKFFAFLFFIIISYLPSLSCATTVERNKTINFIIHNSYDYPLAKLDSRGNLVSGILMDIANEIGQQLNRTPAFTMTSRGRIDQLLLDGKSDLSCFARKEWVKSPQDFFWSDELYKVENLVVFKKSAPPISSVSDLKKKRIGTLVNYKYPEVDQALGANSYQADTTINMTANFEKLMKNRVQYIFTDSMYYYNLKDGFLLNYKVELEKFTLSKFPILCRLSKKSTITLSELNQAIKVLRKRNFFEMTIRKYSPTFQSWDIEDKNYQFKVAHN